TWSGEVIAGGCDRSISVPPSPSPQPWSRRPSWTRKEQLLPRPPPGLAAERSPGTPGSAENQCGACHPSSFSSPGFPVMCCEDVFLSDPLLPRGQRAPLYVSQARQQVMGSLKLLLPPPVMSPRVLPTPSSGCSTAWLSGPELIALTGLLQMSQGEPRPSSPGAPMPPAGPPDPASDHPGASGGQSCSHCTDPSLPRAPDSQGP
ncbi:hypothetical protein E2I00_014893, partial [Balaenoptera physalus]